ncbi:MAG: type I-E CRISPR-associated protein Cas7/Cse4/CasC [Spirochaetota bacterium]
MSQFIQLHLLTSYAPSNLNRDDLGRPKTAVMGGVERLRISSQSLKRAWRTSDVFEEELKGHIGTRTKLLGVKIYEYLCAKKVKEKSSKEWAQAIAGQFGKLKGGDKNNPLNDLEIEQLVHVGPEEEKDVYALADKLMKENRKPTEDELKLLRKDIQAADIALFGRMLASSPAYNIEAAAQIAHAITVHGVTVEDDYFTAVDDLNTGEVDAGSAHIGETGFGAGLFYTYMCVNKTLLEENLNDKDLANKAIRALASCAAQIAPSGKQNSFASRARASYILAERGSQQPRQLSSAFLNPVSGVNMMNDAIKRLDTLCENMDKVYGNCADNRYEINVEKATGTIEELLKFVTE